MVLGCIEDMQRGSIIPPLRSGVRDSVQVREAVKKCKAILKDIEVSRSSLVAW